MPIIYKKCDKCRKRVEWDKIKMVNVAKLGAKHKHIQYCPEYFSNFALIGFGILR